MRVNRIKGFFGTRRILQVSGFAEDQVVSF